MASSIKINATEQLANAALTYAGGDDIVENFKAAFLKASASGATEDDKLELKRKLFVLGAWRDGGVGASSRVAWRARALRPLCVLPPSSPRSAHGH